MPQQLVTDSKGSFLLPPDAPAIMVNPVKLRREARYFGKFAVVGLIGAVVDITVLNVLIFGMGWSSPLQMTMANVISTCVAIVSNFILNRSWTFRTARSKQSGRQFAQFVAVSMVGLVFNAIIFYVANTYIFGPLLHSGISVQLSKAAAIGVTLFWNFAANRLWTFRQPQVSGPVLATQVEAADGPAGTPDPRSIQRRSSQRHKTSADGPAGSSHWRWASSPCSSSTPASICAWRQPNRANRRRLRRQRANSPLCPPNNPRQRRQSPPLKHCRSQTLPSASVAFASQNSSWTAPCPLCGAPSTGIGG